jgi:RNA polymerase sigma-70 factor (ECF subfamily)
VRTGSARIGGAPGADAELARRARFERIAAEVYEPLQRFLHRRADADDAADVLNDTLLVVWRRLDDVPDEALPWCYGVARRGLANQRRGNRRRLQLVGRATAQADPGSAGRLDPQHAVDAGEPELIAALDSLSDAEAEIVRLWAWEQLEPREIAIVLDTSANAVSVALARAKRKLAEQLDRQDRRDAGHLQDARSTNQEGDDR